MRSGGRDATTPDMAPAGGRPGVDRLPAIPGVTSVPPIPAGTRRTEVRMPEPTTTDASAEVPAPAAEEALVEESLVEEVSIDGMCGGY